MEIQLSSKQQKDTLSWLSSGSINIFGLPFAGKDTLAHNLADTLGAPVISGGDILRSYPDKEKIKSLMETGKLFPTDFYLSVITPYLKQSKLKDRPLILSSVGRWKGEESSILKACKQSGHPIKAVIHLDVPEEVVWKRFEASKKTEDRGQRIDDAVHVLEERLKEYRTKTLPVLKKYEELGLLIKVEGHRQKKSTTKAALEALLDFAASHA